MKLSEKQLRNIIRKRLSEATETKSGWDFSNVDFSKTPGINLPADDEGGWYHSPKEIKEKLQALQNAVKDVMDLMNGDQAGSEFSKEMWDECYRFYTFISQYYVELVKDCSDFQGSWEEDHTNVPFIRKYTDDYGIPNYFDKTGKQVGDETFRQNFKPRERNLQESVDRAVRVSMKKVLNENPLTKWAFEDFYKKILAQTKQNPCRTTQEVDNLIYSTVTSSPYYDQNSVYDFWDMVYYLAHMSKNQFYQACMGNQQMNQKATPNPQQTWVERGSGRSLSSPTSEHPASYLPGV